MSLCCHTQAYLLHLLDEVNIAWIPFIYLLLYDNFEIQVTLGTLPQVRKLFQFSPPHLPVHNENHLSFSVSVRVDI